MMYKYELWFDGQIIHAEDDFESEEDANYDAETEIDYRIDTWKIDGSYHGETHDDFDIVIDSYEENEVADFQNDLECKYVAIGGK